MNKEDLPFYVASDILRQQNKAYKKVTAGDQDRLYVITGREGVGKSTFCMQLAYVVDPNLCLNNIVFTPKQFEDRIRNAKKFEAIIYDEGFSGLSSKGSISKQNKQLVRLLMECRQRNLFIFIVLPSFFLLEKYIAIFRSTALFNVLASKRNFKLRYYKVYNYQQKKLLYIKGKTMMDYSKPKISKSYRFYKKLPPGISDEGYRHKKLMSFRNNDGETTEESKHLKQRAVLSKLLKEKFDFNYVEQMKILESCGCGVADTVLSRSARYTPLKIQNT
ncbi:hypothetical protein LCGC14_0862850 [marine sediment metagenome]|uniref:Novel STAND NTPase 3 domain-containing protein n=1 Tax=marine sediment metagenome TaxID=412755 RepID=A0A0F9SDY2_9ZZZZ